MEIKTCQDQIRSTMELIRRDTPGARLLMAGRRGSRVWRDNTSSSDTDLWMVYDFDPVAYCGVRDPIRRFQWKAEQGSDVLAVELTKFMCYLQKGRLEFMEWIMLDGSDRYVLSNRAAGLCERSLFVGDRYRQQCWQRAIHLQRRRLRDGITYPQVKHEVRAKSLLNRMQQGKLPQPYLDDDESYALVMGMMGETRQLEQLLMDYETNGVLSSRGSDEMESWWTNCKTMSSEDYDWMCRSIITSRLDSSDDWC